MTDDGVSQPLDSTGRRRRLEWIDHVCSGLYDRFADLADGEPASYIPELAAVDPDRFAIAAVTSDGAEKLIGDHSQTFTIQSISKLMLYGLALETHGRDAVLDRVGVAPTGDRFNSIELDEATHRAPNPMVNAGAIAITDMVVGSSLDDRFETLYSLFERYLGRRPIIAEDVWKSERDSGNRNRAIAYLLLDRGIVEDRVDETLELYFAQCSIVVDVRDLAVIGATIANNGRHPSTDAQVIAPHVARDIMTIALTCGMYDYSGEWAYTVGIPAKSGVGGGIVGMVPGLGGLAAFSPRLDEHGNSVRGQRVFERLSQEFDIHLFDAERPWTRPVSSSTPPIGCARA